ncbi:hypothetical protein [Streptacidiphilus fuscans]|uniref:Uncharacterized protein n=1 Tax=Streptacidiphilus fuscans TaxID=2789292 RepID=A0A931B9U7_9ACTN|nr:hypothetical protein [Streptacidiphilus fuscans]MBF9072716.1 hypothetical protein [Streptacidiphilus fuscans]
MFDSYPPPPRSLHQDVPANWPVLLLRAEPPTGGDPCSTRRRDAVVAMRDGSWEEAVVWAWAWNESGRPVRWRCQVEVGGHVSWYRHDGRLIRPVD